MKIANNLMQLKNLGLIVVITKSLFVSLTTNVVNHCYNHWDDFTDNLVPTAVIAIAAAMSMTTDTIAITITIGITGITETTETTMITMKIAKMKVKMTV